jgi:excisionase family DNA binding protein
MNVFFEVAKELDELRRRVEQLEADARTGHAHEPPRTAYRVREVAALVGLSAKTIRQRIADGRLEAEDMGGWWAISPAAVQKAFGDRSRNRVAS